MPKGRVLLGFLLVWVLSTGRAPLAQPQPALTPALLAGLPFRTIGPANMSGRIVDIAVVEANQSTFHAASATGGPWEPRGHRPTTPPRPPRRPRPAGGPGRSPRADACPSASRTPTSCGPAAAKQPTGRARAGA